MRYIRVLSDLSGQMKYAAQKRVLIEIALIKLCRPAMETSQDALIDRISQLEKRIESGVVMTVSGGNTPQNVRTEEKTAGGKSVQEKPEMPDALPEEIQRLIVNWNTMLLELHPRYRVDLTPAKSLSLEMKGTGSGAEEAAVDLENGTGNELILTFSRDREYAYQEISIEEHRKEIEDIFSKTIGKKIQLIVKLDEGSGSFQKTHHSVEDFMNVFGKAGIPVENEEE